LLLARLVAQTSSDWPGGPLQAGGNSPSRPVDDIAGAFRVAPGDTCDASWCDPTAIRRFAPALEPGLEARLFLCWRARRAAPPTPREMDDSGPTAKKDFLRDLA